MEKETKFRKFIKKKKNLIKVYNTPYNKSDSATTGQVRAGIDMRKLPDLLLQVAKLSHVKITRLFHNLGRINTLYLYVVQANYNLPTFSVLATISSCLPGSV